MTLLLRLCIIYRPFCKGYNNAWEMGMLFVRSVLYHFVYIFYAGIRPDLPWCELK
jgi:hypothetical protein